MLEQWTGTCRATIFLEIFVYFSFLFTLVLFVTRSRILKRCGVDNSEQFEDAYMSYLADKIVQAIVFDEKGQINHKFKQKFWVNRLRTVTLEGVVLKVRLTQDDFNSIKHKLEEDEKTTNFVSEEEAIGWVSRCIEGNTTKLYLDQERQAESNVLD